MGRPARASVVLVRFPFSDLSRTKRRPALVLAEVEYGDLLLCQITSKVYKDRNAVCIGPADFQKGTLPVTSYARPGRIMTAHRSLVIDSVAILTEAKHQEVVAAISKLIA